MVPVHQSVGTIGIASVVEEGRARQGPAPPEVVAKVVGHVPICRRHDRKVDIRSLHAHPGGDVGVQELEGVPVDARGPPVALVRARRVVHGFLHGPLHGMAHALRQASVGPPRLLVHAEDGRACQHACDPSHDQRVALRAPAHAPATHRCAVPPAPPAPAGPPSLVAVHGSLRPRPQASDGPCRVGAKPEDRRDCHACRRPAECVHPAPISGAV